MSSLELLGEAEPERSATREWGMSGPVRIQEQNRTEHDAATPVNLDRPTSVTGVTAFGKAEFSAWCERVPKGGACVEEPLSQKKTDHVLLYVRTLSCSVVPVALV